jgi:hypothetical protein
MTVQLFKELTHDRDAARAERDLYLQQLELRTCQLIELIAGIKTLSEMLQLKRPNKVQCQVTEDLVNRMIEMARRYYAAVQADEQAVTNLRKATGEQ